MSGASILADTLQVLLVEDDESTCVLVHEALRDVPATNLQLQRVAGHDRAIHQLCDNRYDIALVSESFGLQGGLALVREARACGSRIPIIVLTRQHEPELDELCMTAGANDHFAKNEISSDMLRRAVRYAVSNRRAEDQRNALMRETMARAHAEEITRAKEELLALVSHELRNPLGVIMARASLLEMQVEDAEAVRESARVIRRSAKQQSRMIDDLLDISRLRFGKVQLDCKELEVTTVLQEAITAVKERAQSANVVIELSSSPPLPVFGDPGRLHQVFSNILDNAVKFSSPGQRVTIRALQDGETVCVSFIDEGVGLQQGEHTRILERFDQGPSPHPAGKKGLGLGLAVCKELIALHHGTLALSSEGPDKGTTVSVWLPRTLRATHAPHVPSPAPA